MRKTFSTVVAVALLAGVITVAEAQDRRGRDRDDDEFGPATAQQLAAADRNDRRARGWYSQEAALRSSERAWIAFRDAECRYLTQQDAGARGYSALMRGCLHEQTEERTEELRDAEILLSSR
ncbi:MAG: lysozyme inhibitor LprI family protein [Caulobacteraceae bacterium]